MTATDQALNRVRAVSLCAPTVQIWAGWHYRHAECPYNLSLWLWVNGVGWLTFLSIFALSVLSSSGQSSAATFTLAACFPCAVCAMCVVGPFLVVWFIVGNIWIFAGNNVSTAQRTAHSVDMHRAAHTLLQRVLTGRMCACCAAAAGSCVRRSRRAIRVCTG